MRRRLANDRPRQPPKAFFRRMCDLARLIWVLPSTTRCCSMWHTHPLSLTTIRLELASILDLASNPALIRGRKKHNISIHYVEYDWYNERTLGPRIAVVMGRWRLVDLRASFCGSIGTLIRGTMLGWYGKWGPAPGGWLPEIMGLDTRWSRAPCCTVVYIAWRSSLPLSTTNARCGLCGVLVDS